MSQGSKSYRALGLHFRALCLVLPVAGLLCAGCAKNTFFLTRQATAQAVADPAGLSPVAFTGEQFTVHGYARGETAQVLTVYIEGDGFAWANRSTPSDDPTPKDPLALRLAAADPSPAVAYLSRPCQYPQPGDAPACEPYYWTFGRFSPAMAAALSQALDRLKARFGAKSLRLAGYSGGGAMAVLLAARRDDVSFVATVAGNLDTALWCSLHKLTPLAGSLNPADFAAMAAHIPQVHFVGSRDGNMPGAVAESFAARAASQDTVKLVTIPDFTHSCCWEKSWPQLIRDHFPR
jgi:pimeloyl-ACP methyl ester carboxylesterase